ncbi:MAG TPA: Nif3-like dinuclear metal center hexameric protein, partial [Chitinophagaceae bacterium]|nr:Nif3-like dinuclear metal center hexameric protein [Chitinophagaceae bacterium]
FNVEGMGTFKAGMGAHPYVGDIGKQHQENEIKIEVIFPSFAEGSIIRAMKAVHPYEEIAFDIVPLMNQHASIGAGIVGELPQPIDERDFLAKLKAVFGTPVIRHTSFINRQIQKVALCGGAGSFLISKALAAAVDAYITADIKYHEFFDANSIMLLCDIGHFESEQFTIDLLQENLEQKFPTFAVLKTGVKTNPVHYY